MKSCLKIVLKIDFSGGGLRLKKINDRVNELATLDWRDFYFMNGRLIGSRKIHRKKTLINIRDPLFVKQINKNGCFLFACNKFWEENVKSAAQRIIK